MQSAIQVSSSLRRYFSRSATVLLALFLGMQLALAGVDFQPVDAARAQRDHEKALTLLEQMRTGNEANGEWLWRMARTYFEKAYQLSPSDKRRSGLLDQGLEYARKALAANERSAEAHFWYAAIAGERALYQGSDAKIKISHEIGVHGRRTIELDPNYVDAYHMMGRWHYELSDLSWVERTLAETLFSKLPDATIEEAVRNFEKAARLDPKNVAHRLWLAKSYLRMGQKEKAKATLQIAVELKPRDAAETRDVAEARKLLNGL